MPGWLRCESLDRGMFSDELVVTVLLRDGTEESHFVPAEHVQRERKRVRVAFHDTGSVMWATLPTPDSSTIPVSKAHVEPLDEWPEEFLACLGSLDEDIPRPPQEPIPTRGVFDDWSDEEIAKAV
jgi:hypothetical protein